MIISPPFLPLRAIGMTDTAFVAAAMLPAATNSPGTAVPEGSFPVSSKLGWHGGVHLHAPSVNGHVMPVCAVVDGEIVYARQPTAQVSDQTHALNYNPFGTGPAWTDDGIVIVRHRTDIGAGVNGEGCEFYSVIVHLSSLMGNAAKVAHGTATAAERKVFRKDELGTAGKIYGSADHIHFEIVCDDDNLNKLVGRRSGRLAQVAQGRQDAVYGEVYFRIPSGAPLYTDRPPVNVAAPTTGPTERTSMELIVGMRYASGDGAPAQRGSVWTTTYRMDGKTIGSQVEDANFDYELYSRANEISQAFPEGRRPVPSAVYELLRFGRILDGSSETLMPSDCPYWRRVQGEAGQGWINLNAAGISKFSDADFPDWRQWRLVDDDTDDDSRAESGILAQVIEEAVTSSARLEREDLERHLGQPEVRAALAKCICKFPSEWNRDSIDARWGWLQSDTNHGVTGDDWNHLRAHIAALTIAATSLPAALVRPHWHFHPTSFITHFRQCLWLSADEFKQLVPKHAMRRHRGSYVWEEVQTNLTAATSVAVRQRIALNRMTRKYGINSSMRLASFYGNAIQETQWLGLLSEGQGSTLWYAPWYGRGFLQLTNPENYISYWRFRGRQVPDSLKESLAQAYNAIAHQPPPQRTNATLNDTHFSQLTTEMRGWRDEVKGVAMTGSNESAVAPADSAGFYWAKLRMASYADSDHVLARVVVTTNQGAKPYYRSPSFWRASAAVNLPASINNLYSAALNGFDARCVAYAYALAVLSEMRFPDSAGNATLIFPEGYIPRR